MTRVEMELRVQNAIQASTLSNTIKTSRVNISKVVLDALMPVEVAKFEPTKAVPVKDTVQALKCGLAADVAALKPVYRFTVE